MPAENPNALAGFGMSPFGQSIQTGKSPTDEDEEYYKKALAPYAYADAGDGGPGEIAQQFPEDATQQERVTLQPTGRSFSSSTSVTPGAKYDPEIMRMYKEEFDRQAKIAEDQKTFESSRLSEEARIKQEYNQRQAKFDAETMAINQANQAAVAAQQQKLVAIEDEVAKQKIDPDHFWANKGMASKIAAGLALALGGFAEGFSMGRVKNTALQMLTDAIDRDIAAQRANMQGKAQSAQSARGTLSMLIQKTGSDLQGRHAQTILAADSVQRKLDENRANMAPMAYEFASDVVQSKKKQELLNMLQTANLESQDKVAKSFSSSTQEMAPVVNFDASRKAIPNSERGKITENVRAQKNFIDGLGKLSTLVNEGMSTLGRFKPEFMKSPAEAEMINTATQYFFDKAKKADPGKVSDADLLIQARTLATQSFGGTPAKALAVLRSELNSTKSQILNYGKTIEREWGKGLMAGHMKDIDERYMVAKRLVADSIRRGGVK